MRQVRSEQEEEELGQAWDIANRATACAMALFGISMVGWLAHGCQYTSRFNSCVDGNHRHTPKECADAAR